MKKLYFNNFNCHNGDLHYYRAFIKDIINKTDFDEYYLLEKKSSTDVYELVINRILQSNGIMAIVLVFPLIFRK